MQYVRLNSSGRLPDLSALAPFKAVVVVDAPPGHVRADEIAGWLVTSGCLYMMSYGSTSGALADAVNLANLRAFKFGQIPDERLVICTAHENEPLEKVFWFAKHTAMHPCFLLDNLALIHIGPPEREHELLEAYARS